MSQITSLKFKIDVVKRNGVFATNSNFLITIALPPDGMKLWYFKLILLELQIHSLKYIRFRTLGCKDIGIRKSEFVAKTQFLSI